MINAPGGVALGTENPRPAPDPDAPNRLSPLLTWITRTFR